MASWQTSKPTHRLYLRVEGWVADDWTAHFEDITVQREASGSTVFSGFVKDQAALFGILHLIENRGMKLIHCFAYPGGVS